MSTITEYTATASLGPRALSPTHAQFLHMTFGPQELKNRGENGIFYHVSDVEGREKVERTRLHGGGQTRKQTVAHAFVQSPVTCRCTAMYILLARRKATPSLTVACTVARWSISMIYACTPALYMGLVYTFSIYAYSTYDTGQYPPRYYPAAAQSPNL